MYALGQLDQDPEFIAQMQKGQYEITTAKPDEIQARMQRAVTEFNSVKDMVQSHVK